MKTVLLSHFIDNNSPYYLGTTKPSIKPNTQIKKGDDYNTYDLSVGNHCGTHVDAPKHFIETGKEISEYNIEELIFTQPLVLECLKGNDELLSTKDLIDIDLDGYDCLLFRTGFGKYRDKDLNRYLTHNPGISLETIQWIRENYKDIRCLGIDSISISRYGDGENAKKTHLAAFNNNESYGKPLLLIEDMKLDTIPENSNLLDKMVIVPWNIKGIDSAPCNVIAALK
jgi:kynurenine formamidase